MPNPLSREWLPDAERMRSTTAWILLREPLLVRIAPLVILCFVLALAGWAAQAKVDVYESVPASVSAASGDTLLIHFDAGREARVQPGASVVVLPAGVEPGGARVEASVLSITRSGQTTAGAIATVITAPDAPAVPSGPAMLRIKTGQRALLDEFVAAARGGRKGR